MTLYFADHPELVRQLSLQGRDYLGIAINRKIVGVSFDTDFDVSKWGSVRWLSEDGETFPATYSYRVEVRAFIRRNYPEMLL